MNGGQPMKRLLSMILVLVLLVGMLPLPARATEGTNAEVTNDEVTIAGTNGFGNLLSEDIQTDYEEEMDYSGGYGVTNLTIAGNTAVVEYHTLEEATLVVGIYTEDGLRMITSGKAAVSPDFTEATVTIAGTMPEYFQASAYLVDNYDYSPLCEAYDTPMYTRAMQDLLSATVDDFDPDRVMNLDGDKTTNFAVYAEATKVLEEQAGVNTIASVNDDTMTYVIENADENITSLQPGDVLAYPYGSNDILIVKVASITMDGTTATITGAELEMEEVFSHVKIEADGDAGDVTVDESTGDGITYTGISDGGSTYGLRGRALEGGGDGGLTLNFDLQKGEYKEDDKESWEVSGTLSLKFTVKFSYYVALDDYFITFDIDNTLTLQNEVKGKHTGELAKFPTFGFSPVAGVYIGFEPVLVLNFEMTFQFKLVYTDGVSFHFEKGESIKRYSKKPTVDTSLEVEGKIFFGVDMQPKVKIVNGTVLEFTLSALGGVELAAKYTGKLQLLGSEERDDQVHDCNACISGEVTAKLEFSVKMTFLKMKKLTFNFKLALLKYKLGSLYYSIDNEEFGWGGCPYIRYQTIFIVKAQNGKVLPDHEVRNSAGEILGITDKNGQVIQYLSNGTYDVSAVIEGEEVKQRAIVLGKAKRVVLRSGATDQPAFGIFGTIDTVTITNYGKVIASGNCGPEEDGINSDAVTWTLYENGALILQGDGEISVPKEESWQDYAYQIYHVAICDGITGIPEKAFYALPNMVELVIADSVTNWGDLCFGDCTALKDVTVPVDYMVSLRVTGNLLYGSAELISQNPFDGCCNVESIRYTVGQTGVMADRNGEVYYYGDSGGYTYKYANNYTMEVDSRATLKHVVFEEGITHIGSYAFYYARYSDTGTGALETFDIPSTVTSIGDEAIYEQPNLKFVSLPDGLTYLGKGNFAGCGLEEIMIPSTLTSISGSTFTNCPLKTVEIPNSVTEIGGYAFYGCEKLESVDIPDSVTSIGEYAFSGCVKLEELVIPDTASNLSNHAFYGCTNLKKVTLPVDFSRTYESGSYSYGAEVVGNCPNIEHIVYTPGATGIMTGAARDKYDTTMEYYARNSLKKVEFAEGVGSVGAYAFKDCTVLTDVILPSTLLGIGGNAFENCSSLETLDMPASLQMVYGAAFANCSGLKHIAFEHGLIEIKASAFKGCTALETVEIPSTIEEILDNAFESCTALRSVKLTDEEDNPSVLFQIAKYAFADCSNLETIEIPASTKYVESYAFNNCNGLKRVVFKGSETHPSQIKKIYSNTFQNVNADVYYPVEDSNWTADMLQQYGGKLNWIPYTLDENGEMILPEAQTEPTEPEVEETIPETTGETVPETAPEETLSETTAEETVPETTVENIPETTEAVWETVPADFVLAEVIPEEPVPYAMTPLAARKAEETVAMEDAVPVPYAITGGQYSDELAGETVVKIAEFKDLVPGEQYVLLVLKDLQDQDPLNPDNLLYIDQAAAGEDGTLEFRYIPREELEVTYVAACGAANQSLEDAVITIPEMQATGNVQTVEPVVKYKGKNLIEEQDYTLLGQLSATKPGEYTLYIRGIYNYSGLVECKFTILPAAGDLDGDGVPTESDVLYLIWHTLFPEMYPLDETKADFDGDDTVTDADAVLLLWHILFPEQYPL